MAGMKLAVLVVAILMVVATAMSTAQPITCDELSSTFRPCTTYLVTGGTPSRSCCYGLGYINNVGATSSQLREVACKCLQTAIRDIRGVFSQDYAEALPGICKVDLPYKISLDTDCLFSIHDSLGSQ
ncbi:Non-specific lipid-transfer protein 1 [Euphorbia peplus]|nr:Non-specific lipid-transfer protein 1 [Euphorbia peplus]